MTCERQERKLANASMVQKNQYQFVAMMQFVVGLLY